MSTVNVLQPNCCHIKYLLRCSCVHFGLTPGSQCWMWSDHGSQCWIWAQVSKVIYHLPPGFLSLRKEEPLPELSPQTPVSGYSWPRRTQVADKAVSPSCFRSSLPSLPFSWCPLCHSFCPSVVFESCNVSHPSMYSLLDNVYDIIYTCLMSYPGITFVVA